MIRPSPLDDPSQDDEHEFAAKFEEFSNRVLEGEEIPWDEIRIKYPSWVDRLQKLLPTVKALANDRKRTFSDSIDHHLDEPSSIDNYQLKRVIGRGGMGVVWEGVENASKRRVAIKLLDPELARDGRARLRFENEALATSRLDHPNIVPILAIGESHGDLYYSMPFIEGMTLAEMRSQWVEKIHAEKTKQDDIPPELLRSVLRIGIEAATALQAAHETGVVHRDIKPSNILVEPNGHLWILDFGLACLEGQKTLTESGEIVGTLRYMAPERFTSSIDTRFDPRIDVYSLGATLYELLALEPPYAGYPQAALLRVISNSPPMPLGLRVPVIPSDVVHVIEKAMEREPRYRYPTCQDFAKDLQRIVNGEKVQAKRITAWTRGQRFAQSNPIRFAGASLLIAMAVVFATIALTWRNQLLDAQNKSALQEALLTARADEIRSKELFVTVSEARERRLNKFSGWRAKSLSQLETAATNAKDDTEKRMLRDEYAATLMGRDLEYRRTLMNDVDVYCGTWSPDGKLLAIGMNMQSAEYGAICFLDGENLTTLRGCRLPSPRDLGLGSESLVGVRSMAFTPDGGKLIVGMRTGLIHVVDPYTGVIVQSRRQSEKPLFAMHVSPDGTLFACGGEDGKLYVLSLQYMNEHYRYGLNQKITDIAWRQSEVLVYSGSDGGTTMHRFESERDRLDYVRSNVLENTTGPSCMPIHGGLGLVGRSHDGIAVYDSALGRLVRTLRASHRDTQGDFTDSSTFQLSPNADQLITTHNRGIQLWDYGSGEHILRIPVAGNSAVGTAIHPTNGSVIAWGNNQVSFYQLADPVGFDATLGRLNPIWQIGIGRRESLDPFLADMHFEQRHNNIDLVEISTVRLNGQTAHSPDVLRLGYSNCIAFDGETFAAWSDEEKSIWIRRQDTKRDEICSADVYGVFLMRMNSNIGQLYVAVDEPIPGKKSGIRSKPLLRCVSLETGRILWECRSFVEGQPIVPMTLVDIVISDGKVWCVTKDSSLWLIDTETGMAGSVGRLSIKDISRIVPVDTSHWLVGTRSGELILVDRFTRSYIQTLQIHSDAVTGLGVFPDGTVVSSGLDGNLFVCSFKDKRLREEVRIQYPNLAIEEMDIAPRRDFVYLRCRNEHVGRCIRLGELRAIYKRMGIDW